jgi:hypothetical protein
MRFDNAVRVTAGCPSRSLVGTIPVQTDRETKWYLRRCVVWQCETRKICFAKNKCSDVGQYCFMCEAKKEK